MIRDRIIIITFVLISIAIASFGYYILNEGFSEKHKKKLRLFHEDVSDLSPSLEYKSKIFFKLYAMNANQVATIMWSICLSWELFLLYVFKEKLLKEKSPWKNRTVLLTYIIASVFMVHEMIFDLPFVCN